MDKKDLYIKAKLQEDKKISSQANEMFEKFEGGINLENNNKQKERKILKISLNHAILAFTSLIVVVILGGNLYAHIQGKPNIYSAIKNLFIKEAKYTESEIIVDQTVESNGIKLTLKTVAMDENVLITKYVAEGEKLANEFYTYPEFEEEEIKIAKIRNVLNGNDIGEKGYDGYTQKDITLMRRDVVAKLKASGATEEEAKTIEEKATKAYEEYIGAQLSEDSGYSLEKAKEQIAETIAMFESKVSSKYQIMASNDTLQEFSINAISQKIERSGNQYIIYNVYNVDTISDLASEFKLVVNVSKIGSISGTWNFETELEKARLDTRVETINFYENNSYDNVAPNITLADKVRHTATVEAKKLIISDFSTVLMIQTMVDEEDREHYLDGYAHNGLPCVFVVTDEEGNVLGTGSASEGTFESAINAGDVIKYTDRIILENVDKDTKKLYVKIYEQWDMSEYGYEELEKVNIHTMVLDIEEARNSSKPIELTQSYASKEVQVSFKYPGEWTVKEQVPTGGTDSVLELQGPEDVDGKRPVIRMYKIENTEKDELKELVNFDEMAILEEEGNITVGEQQGYYKKGHLTDAYYGKIVATEKDGEYFSIEYYAYSDSQYARYEETFNKILETIEFVEPEKSYKTFGNGSSATIKLYEDGVLTIAFSTGISEKIKGNATAQFPIKDNVEYTVTGNIPENITNITVMYVASYELETPDVFIETEEKELYYINVINAMNTGKFVVEEKLMDNVVTSSIHRATDEIYKNLKISKDVIFPMIETTDGKIYTIWVNDTTGRMSIEEYIEPTEKENEQENNSNNQQTQNNEQYTVLYDKDICTIKQYERNKRITVEWKDTDYNYQEIKYGSIKTNNEYTITGMQGPVKEVFIIHKDRQDENLPGILFWCENNKIYYVRWDIVHSDSAINILWEDDNITEISQISGTWLDAKKGNSDCTITFTGIKYLTDAQAEAYIEKFFQEEVYENAQDGVKYQVIDIRANGTVDGWYYYDVDLYIINGERTEKTTWGFELLNSNGNIVRGNIVKP